MSKPNTKTKSEDDVKPKSDVTEDEKGTTGTRKKKKCDVRINRYF